MSALTLGAGAAVAAAAEPDVSPVDGAELEANLLERPGKRLLTSIEAHQELDRMRDAYRRLAGEASAIGVEVESPVPPAGLTADQLAERTEELREQIREAEDAAMVAGVPRSTLDAIASCESGGDPTAVSSEGSYRGKYQFDRGTWASIGGSGDPAAAPEAEQDYRAALLYQRSGSNPWPVCG